MSSARIVVVATHPVDLQDHSADVANVALH